MFKSFSIFYLLPVFVFMYTSQGQCPTFYENPEGGDEIQICKTGDVPEDWEIESHQ